VNSAGGDSGCGGGGGCGDGGSGADDCGGAEERLLTLSHALKIASDASRSAVLMWFIERAVRRARDCHRMDLTKAGGRSQSFGSEGRKKMIQRLFSRLHPIL
jgi:hypothetical protein